MIIFQSPIYLRLLSKNHWLLLSFGNIITFGLSQSDHINRLLLYLGKLPVSAVGDCLARSLALLPGVLDVVVAAVEDVVATVGEVRSGTVGVGHGRHS